MKAKTAEGLALKLLRVRAELSIPDAAGASRVSVRMIHYYETGDRVPTAEKRAALLTAYGSNEQVLDAVVLWVEERRGAA